MHDRSPIEFRIGVDGGGSGTRARLVTSAGASLGEGEAGPSALGQGVERAWSNVVLAIARAIASAGLNGLDPARCGLGLGLAGAHVSGHCADFLRIASGYGRVALDTDSFAALLGAHAGGAGVLVAVGTGSVGESLALDGTRRTVGGWGFPVGDEGSGAWLGLGAMRVAQHALDGRSTAGALAKAVWRETGASRETLLAWCSNAGQNVYGQLAPLVFAAQDADPAAGALIVAVCQSIHGHWRALDPDGKLPLALHGSIALRVAPQLAPTLRARLKSPAGDALDGALRILARAMAMDS